MPQALSDWRMARSFIGNNGTASLESAELDFNIGTREAIEIASVYGHLPVTVITTSTSIAPVHAVQSLRVEDGTVEVLSNDAADADQFDNDSEVIFEQNKTFVSFDVATEGGGPAVAQSPTGQIVFANPILSAINLTHVVENVGLTTVGGLLLIEYRYVSLSDRELAFQFARRRR